MRVMAVVMLMAALVSCSSGAGQPAASRTSRPSPGAVRVAIYGDSLTQGLDEPVTEADYGTSSWTHYADFTGFAYVGGWAQRGATSEVIASQARPADAEVLVILAGTNDVNQALPFARSQAALESIVRTVGAPRVLVMAIPPFDAHPTAAAEYNRRLAALARAQGWTLIDPFAAMRTSSNGYRPGLSTDGIHPTRPPRWKP